MLEVGAFDYGEMPRLMVCTRWSRTGGKDRGLDDAPRDGGIGEHAAGAASGDGIAEGNGGGDAFVVGEIGERGIGEVGGGLGYHRVGVSS